MGTHLRTLGEVMQEVLPGQVISMGGLGSLCQPYLGGSRSGDTVVLLDGLRIIYERARR